MEITKFYSPNFDKKKRTTKNIIAIIIHYTGMQSERESLERLISPKSKVSTHFFINRAGKIFRLVKEDYVVVDVDVIEKDSPEKALTNARFQVTKEKMADWMYQLVMGMKVGDVKEGVSQPDKNATQKEKDATPPKKVSLLLRSIER